MSVTVITHTNAPVMVRNQIYWKVQTSKDFDTAGLYFKCEIYDADDNLLTTLISYPDTDAMAVFYIDSILRALLTYDPTNTLTGGLHVAAGRSASYYLKFYDIDPTDLTPTPLTTDPFVAVLAGLPKQQFMKLVSPFQNANLYKNFLTQRNGKNFMALGGQSGWWSMFNNSGGDLAVTLYVNIYVRDSSLVANSYPCGTVPANQFLDIRIDPSYLGLQALVGSGEILYYDLFINSTDNPATRIYVDEYRYLPVDFAYVNCFGGMEWFRCYGDVEQSVEIANDTGDKFVNAGDYGTINFADRTVVKTKELESNKVYSGYQSTSDQFVVRDFFNSRVKFKIDTDLNILVPISIREGSITMGKRKEILHAVEFEYEELTWNEVANGNVRFMQ